MAQFQKVTNYKQSSRSINWAYENDGFGTFGPESDHSNSLIFDFQGLIYLKVEHACLSTDSDC